MKAKTTVITFALCCALLQPASALPQTARRKTEPTGMSDAAYMRSSPSASRHAENNSARSADSATLETTVQRDGLQFYFEICNGGLSQLSKAASGLSPIMKLFKAGQKNLTAGELAGFMMSNATALSNARLALVNYATSGAAVLIETASASEAEQVHKGITRLLAGDAATPRATTSATDAAEMDARVYGRVVIAGVRSTVALLARESRAATLVDDKEFAKARARFSDDPFFGFLEMSSAQFPLVPGGVGQGSDYTAGMLAALGSMPYAIALGGSIEADAVALRALLLYGSKKSEGLLSSIMAATHAGQSRAANFAAPDTEFFVDVMLDWSKLYEAIESLFAAFASAANANAQPGGMPQGGPPSNFDPLAAAEASLGFSIKHDLLPTLGNELAISLTGFGNMMNAAMLQRKASASATNTPAKLPTPRFTFMLEVRDPIKFEKMFTKLFSKLSKSAEQPFARVQHRGATINYRKGMAYTITERFLIAGGSAAEIRRALDAHALGASLASSRNFQVVMGVPRPTMLQVYMSSAVSNSFFKMISTEAVKAGATLAASKPGAAQSQSPLGVVITPDADGTMIEMRVPTELALMALSSLVTTKPAPFGIHSPYTGGENSNGAMRGPGGRKSPRLTDEDLRHRRP